MTHTSPFPANHDQLDLAAQVRVLGEYFQSSSACGLFMSVKTDDRLAVWLGPMARVHDADLSVAELDRGLLNSPQRLAQARVDPQAGQCLPPVVYAHHLLAQRYVLHTHMPAAEMLCCAVAGKQLVAELLGDRQAIWLDDLADGVAVEAVAGAGEQLIFTANGGLIVASDSADGLADALAHVAQVVERQLAGRSVVELMGGADEAPANMDLVRVLGPLLRAATSRDNLLNIARFHDSPLIRALVNGPMPADLAEGPISVGQMVFCGVQPLVLTVDGSDDEAVLIDKVRQVVDQYYQLHQVFPKVVLVPGLGMFAVAADIHLAMAACDAFEDVLEAMAGAQAIGGGINRLSESKRVRIAEHLTRLAGRSVIAGRMAGRVAVVTGAAQGFGLEIAQQFAHAGGSVVLCDLNVEGARAAADAICLEHGPGRAIGVGINVTDGQSIGQCLDDVIRCYGGFDVFIANAGVLKAGSVKELPEKDFDFVTNVNYKGYFLCVQKASPILARQFAVNSNYRSDIIQINSKSGLVGSNKNGAYAGGKFGGIGLTQSFALELVTDGIKVNSICPGNFFDGPLWSDPDRGLFVQYLNTGKVPGAKTIADVKAFYEAKVPMGRGCTTPDVMQAVFYLVDQKYETGQAVPVTGGQVMLN